MIMSALISQCRREYQDPKKSSFAQKASDGTTLLYNLGKWPILENSYGIKANTSAKVENTDFTLDLDNGDLLWLSAHVPASAIQIKAQFKYANWRDLQWVEAINQGIDDLNGRGFFRQVVRNQNIFSISANVRLYSGPSACIDAYELLESDNSTISGNWRKVSVNWSYQQDENKIVFGQKPVAPNRAAISYLRNMQTYSAVSATVDVKNDWLEMIKKRAGAIYYRSMAAKIATQGNASIDEGHFSFTNLRTQANDLDNDFDKLAKVKKPTRPAKDLQYNLETGGSA